MSTNKSTLRDIKDSDWVRQSFFIPVRGTGKRNNARAKDMSVTSGLSYAQLSFADTSPGGNRSINPKPQFTPYADLRLPSFLDSSLADGSNVKNGSLGMGRIYQEVYDNSADRIYMQFGVPAFNSLTNFLTSFYDSDHGNMANSGRVSSDFFYTAGKFAGFIFFWSVVPELCVLNLLYSTANKAIADATKRPMYKFYYMRAAMPLYWTTLPTVPT